MTTESLTENWALWAALVPGVVAVVALMYLGFQKSARGQLRRTLTDHRDAVRELNKANRSVRKSESRVKALAGKAERVKPRVLQEAKEALEDARSLAMILDDKTQVTANHLRRVIFEEFPPNRHDKLRAKYLPQDVEDKRPFSF